MKRLYKYPFLFYHNTPSVVKFLDSNHHIELDPCSYWFTLRIVASNSDQAFRRANAILHSINAFSDIKWAFRNTSVRVRQLQMF